MKAAAVLALALLVVFIGVPLVGGMAMADCPNCHLTSGSAVGLCLAVLVSFLLLAPNALLRLTRLEDVLRPLLLRTALERPPQPA